MLGPGIHSSGSNQEIPCLCSYVGFFGLDLCMQVLGFFEHISGKTTCLLKHASSRLNYNILDMVAVVFLAVCIFQY